MQIKQSALSQQLQKKFVPMYLLIGQDNYLLEHSFSNIKSFIKKAHDVDEKIITLQTMDDWQLMIQEANSYSLFADMILINAIYDKKTWTVAEKNKLTQYLNAINSRAIIIIRAPNLTVKAIQSLATHEGVLIVLNQPLDSSAMKHWIGAELKQHGLHFEPQIPDLIHLYTQGNMLAAAQMITKVVLIQEPKQKINTQSLKDLLTNQSEHSPFELVEACLLGKTDKALQIIRQAALNKTEAPLLLWLLAQELRLLLQLTTLHKIMDFKAACTQLKIWPQRVKLYELCYKRHTPQGLSKLLQYCQVIDERIKSNGNQVWNALERLAMSIGLGKFIGEI